MFAVGSRQEWLKKLVKAMGFEGQNLKRLVIDIPQDGLVTFYIQRLADVKEMEGFAEVVGELADEDCAVRAVQPDQEIVIDEMGAVRVAKKIQNTPSDMSWIEREAGSYFPTPQGEGK